MSPRAWPFVWAAILAAACGGTGGGEANEATSPAEPAAPERAFAIAAGEVQARELAGGAATARVVLREETTGNGDASLSIVRLDEGAELALPIGGPSATLVFALSGEGQVFGSAREAEPIGAGDAAYGPPGAAVGVRSGEGPLELVVAYAPAGPESGFFEPPMGIRGVPREGLVVRAAGDAERYEIADGLGEVSIYVDGAAVGDVAASLGVLTAGPTMVVPPHVHEDASEYLLLLSGRGVMTVEDEELEVEAGMGVQVPRGVEHAFEVVGDEPVRAVQIYAPAGPEQRFKQ